MDVHTGESRLLARVERGRGPTVGRYRVAVENVAAVATEAIPRALEAGVVVIDEIAPMQLYGDERVAEAERALDADAPVVAAVVAGDSPAFVGEVKSRPDATVREVTPENRDALPMELAAAVRS